jgi:D-3-phosphoglycerate dehydrogenase
MRSSRLDTSMKKVRIAVASGALSDLARLAETFRDHADLVSGPVKTAEQVAELTKEADSLIVSLQPLRAEHIEALPSSIRAIGRAGVGLDTIDLAVAAARGIPVIYQPDYATSEVADHTVALALAAHRRLLPADREVRAGLWPSGPQLGPVIPLQEATVGIVGFGRIGRAVAARLGPCVGRVLAWDELTVGADETVTYVDALADLLGAADIVSLHLPLHESTRRIIGARELRLMRPAAVLVNTSRGGLIDEDALADALHRGAITSAALDVFDHEPLPADSPLRTAPNLMLTPHMAWYSNGSADRLARWSIEDAVDFLRRGQVNRGRLADAP